jgi:hypothetical protein
MFYVNQDVFIILINSILFEHIFNLFCYTTNIMHAIYR